VNVKVENLAVSYGTNEVLKGISFDASAGDCLAILGPNGVGKSTLFRCLLGFIKAQSGRILLGGKPIENLNRAETAREIAYIPQFTDPVFNYTVLDIVLMGVTNRLLAFQGPSHADRGKALEILDELGIAHLADRGCAKISGGERQLALMARALIQDAKVLVMDEPTANLDYGNRYRVMERITELGSKGYIVIFSTHEPNQAFHYANRVLALKDGMVLTGGDPEAVLSSEILSVLYGIDVYVGRVGAGDMDCLVSMPFGNHEKRRGKQK
jgi:iron complex transport system ATP-binding protein